MMRVRVRLIGSLTVVSMALGFMVSLQYRQTQSDRLVGTAWSSGDTEERRLLSQLNQLKELNQKDQGKLAQVTTQISQYEQASARLSARSQSLQARIQAERILSGTTPVAGQGIELSLMDGQGANTEQVLTHDWDIRQVINEIFTAGAEAVSINGYRVVATSGIYCTGPVVRINNHRIGAPFLIQAIGDPSALRSALMIQGGILDLLRSRGVNVSDPQILKTITMPAFTAGIQTSGNLGG